MNDKVYLTPQQLEMLVYEARLETYAAFAISILPIAILITLVVHAFGMKRLTTMSFMACGLITFTIPSPLSRAMGIAIMLAGALVFLIQWLHSPSNGSEVDLKTKGV